MAFVPHVPSKVYVSWEKKRSVASSAYIALKEDMNTSSPPPLSSSSRPLVSRDSDNVRPRHHSSYLLS